MSTTTVILVVSGYVAFVAFVLALLTIARRADEAAEEHARHLASRANANPCPDGERAPSTPGVAREQTPARAIRLWSVRGPTPSGRSWRPFSRFGAGPRRG